MFNPLISFLLTLTVLMFMLKTKLANFALDKPNARSLHSQIIPRTGGLAITLGVIMTWVIGEIDFKWIVFVSVLVGVSLVDDIRELSVRWRLLVQVFISCCFIWVLLPNLTNWEIPIVLLALVWMTNLYNFMDGSDGLAGGMGLFGFCAYSFAAYGADNMSLAMMCACVSASCFAFLLFNFYPARIFMGDAGAIPLGFLAGAIGLYGWQQGNWPLWFPVLVFSPFILDATITLFKRVLRHEKVWQAHREHYYQRLVQMGWGHKKTAIAEYGVMFLVAICALLMLKLSNLWVIFLLLFWLFAYFFIMLKIDKLWKQRPAED